MPITVLLLEDEALISIDQTMELEERGMKVVAAQTIGSALRALDMGKVDVAVLNLLIEGKVTTAVADALRLRSIPFVVCSGSQLPAAASAFEGVQVLDKPYRTDDLYKAIQALEGTPA